MKITAITFHAFAALVLAITITTASFAQNEVSDESGIRSLIAGWEQSWNQYDPKALVNLMTADADFVNVGARHWKGRPQIEAEHASRKNQFNQSIWTTKKINIQFLKSDLALVHIDWEIKGDKEPDGSPRNPRGGVFTWVVVKDHEKWLIRSAQNTNLGPLASLEANLIPTSNKADRQKQQIELSKTNKNHQLLASLNGEWTFKGRHIPADPAQKPIETFGTITRKGIWENRYFITETSGGKKIRMEWADGKEMTYHDRYMEGYDNAKKEFFFTLIANHWSTGYLHCEGNYDSTTKTLTYEGELEPASGTIVKVLRIIKFVDPDHYQEEWHRSIGGKEIQRSEASYTRAKQRR